MSKVAACLQLGVYINTRSGDGLWSGLTAAAAHNCVEVVELLLQQPGLDLNMKTLTFAGIGPYSAAEKRRLMAQFSSEWTALMFACRGGHTDIVRTLARHPNTDLNYR